MRGISRVTIIAVLIILILIGLAAYSSFRNNSEGLYELTAVRKGTLIHKVLATGTINPVVTVQVGSQASGTIKGIYVDYNSPVKKGRLLALIDPAPFYAQLRQAQANLDTAKANLTKQEAIILYSKALLEKADTQLREAELNIKRVRELFGKGLISRSEFDAAEASHDTVLAQKKAQEAQYESELQALNADKARVAQWEGAVNLAKVNLDYAKIKSPIDGIVISRSVDIGQTVAASFQAPTLFVIAEDLAEMEVNARVSEADIGDVKVGQEVTFTVDAYPGKVFTGSVKEIRMAANTVQNVITYSVIARIANKELLLRPSMTADVWIQTAYKADALLAPAVAVKEKEGRRYVESWERKRVVEKEVKTGLKGEGGLIEILSGLHEGEKMIIARKNK